MMNNILWDEQCKIRVRETDISQQKHLIVKALIMLHLKIKHKKDINYIKIYSEYQVVKGKVCDIYFENIRTKEAYAYEVQKNISKKWKEEISKAYENWEIDGIKTTDYIIINLNKLSNNLYELSKQIKELVL